MFLALCHCPEGLLSSRPALLCGLFPLKSALLGEKRVSTGTQSIRHANASPHMEEELEEPSCD